MLSSITALWQEREPREKWLLGIMGVLLGLFVVWQFILTPVLSMKQDARAELATAERDYLAVSRALPGLSGGSRSSGQTFSQAVFIEAARKRGLKPSRIHPDNNRGLSVWIDTQDTQALYGLLNDVITQNGAVLSRAAISKGADQSLTAQLTFRLTP